MEQMFKGLYDVEKENFKKIVTKYDFPDPNDAELFLAYLNGQLLAKILSELQDIRREIANLKSS